MSEGHGELPADVRSFLPRPGEPVEDYAERLRALHRDLTLVLDAVERGLAVSSEPVAPPEPVVVHTHAASGGPRVEVMPAPSGATTRAAGEDRRAPLSLPGDQDEPDPPSYGPMPFPPRPSARDPDEPAAPAEPAWIERPEPALAARPRAVAVTGAPSAFPPVRVEAAPPPSSPADRPWVQSTAVPGGPPAWVDAPAGRGLPPLLVAALLTGWLFAVALLLALLLD